ncbi:hypothetical protein [Cloacibacillus sp.]|uniref:hypothetical protein n=1 Tax=Cloacibacillus sp. TaxID=2049023 RepID=UPI0025C44A3D|nr:hypothetical protein [Cloacibacillus sp.]
MQKGGFYAFAPLKGQCKCEKSINRNIAQPALPGGGIFRFHMAVTGRGEHLQEGNRVIFLNISKVIYGERYESAKNNALRRRGRPAFTRLLR